MVRLRTTGIGPGRHAPARLLLSLLVAAPLPALAQPRPAPPRAAQQQPQRPAPPSAVPVPDELTALRMVWSTMAAVDHANRTGNYSVLRDMGSAGFQANNNPATLAGVFAGIRDRQVDLSNTLLVTPTWEIRPTMIHANILRMRGAFPLRPQPIAFDFLFLWDRGAWRLEGIAVQPLTGR